MHTFFTRTGHGNNSSGFVTLFWRHCTTQQCIFEIVTLMRWTWNLCASDKMSPRWCWFDWPTRDAFFLLSISKSRLKQNFLCSRILCLLYHDDLQTACNENFLAATTWIVFKFLTYLPFTCLFIETACWKCSVRALFLAHRNRGRPVTIHMVKEIVQSCVGAKGLYIKRSLDKTDKH